MATSTPIVPTITQVGLNAAKNADSTGFALKVAKIVFGTSQYTPTGAETALVAPVKTVTIAGGGNVNSTTIQVNAEVLADAGAPFWLGEIGFLTDQNVLLALYSRPASPIAYISDTISFTVAYSLGLSALPAGSVTVQVDPSGSVALSLLGAHETATNPHPQYKQTAADILPPGLTGQVLVQKTNTRGDVEFRDLSAGISINVNTKEETQTFSSTAVTLSTLTTNGIVIYIGGARLDKATDFIINSPTTLTLNRSYPAGTKITFAQNEVAGQVINPLDSTKNLSDVADVPTARNNLGAAAKVNAVFTGTTDTDLLRTKAYADILIAVNATTTTTSLNVTTGVQKVNIQSNTAISFTGTVPTGVLFSFAVITVNDGTAGRSVSWPNVNRWTGGIIPPRTTTANARDIWTFETDDGGVTWGGNLSKADDK